MATDRELLDLDGGAPRPAETIQRATVADLRNRLSLDRDHSITGAQPGLVGAALLGDMAGRALTEQPLAVRRIGAADHGDHRACLAAGIGSIAREPDAVVARQAVARDLFSRYAPTIRASCSSGSARRGASTSRGGSATGATPPRSTRRAQPSSSADWRRRRSRRSCARSPRRGRSNNQQLRAALGRHGTARSQTGALTLDLRLHREVERCAQAPRSRSRACRPSG